MQKCIKDSRTHACRHYDNGIVSSVGVLYARRDPAHTQTHTQTCSHTFSELYKHKPIDHKT